MKRLIAYALGLIILVLLVLVPTVNLPSSSSTTSDPATITDYNAVFTVARNGDLAVTERLTVNFPVDRHGIFRFFDRRDPTDAHARLDPANLRVLRDDKPEPYEVLKEGRGRYRDVKIGSASVSLFGTHVYQIDYTVKGVLEKGTGGRQTQLYWNLIPSGWQMGIAKSELKVNLPAATSDVSCAIGVGQGTGCTAKGTGTDTLTITTGPLAPHTPLTIKSGVGVPTPSRGNILPWTVRFDPVVGSNVGALLIVLILAALAALVGIVLSARTREPRPGFPILYAPPDGVGPAQANYMLTETTNKQSFVATIMQQAEHGATTLKNADGEWSITDNGDDAAWKKLDPISAYAADLLGVKGGSFTASKKDVSAGKTLQSAIATFDSGTKTWATENGLMKRSGLGSLGGVIVVLAILATLVLCIWNPFRMSVLGLIPGLFALCGLPLVLPGAGTKRTATGRDLWSRSGGFKRILSTTSSEDRFDFSSRKDLYTAYIPWAVAFGCADAWAAKYRLETGSEPPVPSYFAGAYAGGVMGSVTSMVDDFSSTVDSAISSYAATQSSSSSGGGGGFSGGGGGGGGGGGSW
jgi:hypothetical protein